MRAAPARAAAVIKANGYGLGLEIVARALYGAGCRMFFVADPREGERARAALGPEARIYVLNGLQPHADPERDYAAHGLAPVIGSAEELARWRALAPPRPFALHLDTGMNRLGFASLDALGEAAARYGVDGADLLMSHFVAAEIPGDPQNARQTARFVAAREAFPTLLTALANSSGIFLSRSHVDWVRPGYAIYGGNPTPYASNPMRAVASLDVVVQQTRWIKPGDTCGYNSQWTAARRTRLATLLAGYADGLPRGAGAVDGREGASVRIAGRMCPLVGRVSMDLAIADVTEAPESEVRPGVFARFFGPDAPLDDFAAKSGTIGYHVLTSLGARYARVVSEQTTP
jgi:alanine racemase